MSQTPEDSSASRADLLKRAQSLAEEGKVKEAEPLAREAVELARATHGSAHPEVAHGLILLAQIEGVIGSPKAAASAAEATAILSSTVGADHPLTKQAEEIQQVLSQPRTEDPFSALMGEVDQLLGRGQVEPAVKLLQEALDAADEAGDIGSVASLSGILAQVFQQVGDKDKALQHAKRALALAERHGQSDAAQHFTQLLAAIEADEGGPPKEVEEVAAALRAAQTALEAGDFEAAVQKAAEGRALASSIQHPMAEANACVVLAQALLKLDRKEEAKEPIERGREIGEKLGHDEIQQAFMALGMQREMSPAQESLFGAMEAMQKGEIDGALALAEGGLAGASERDEVPLRGLLAQSYLEQGQKEKASAHARRAQSLAKQLGDDDAANLFAKLAEVAEAKEEPQES